MLGMDPAPTAARRMSARAAEKNGDGRTAGPRKRAEGLCPPERLFTAPVGPLGEQSAFISI